MFQAGPLGINACSPVTKLVGVGRKVLCEVSRFSKLFLNGAFQHLNSVAVIILTTLGFAIEYDVSI